MVVELHRAARCAKPQAGQGIHDDPQAVRAFKAILPLAGRVPIHGTQKAFHVRSSQRLFHLSRQRYGLRRAPLRQHTCMHHQPAVVVHRHGAVPQPVEQRLAVRCLQNVLYRIVAARLAHTLPQCQQMQVVVAEQAVRGVAQRHQAAQRTQRIRPPVHQIAQKVQSVAAG